MASDQPRVVQLPVALTSWLDGWGRPLQSQFRLASAASWHHMQAVCRLPAPVPYTGPPLRLGSDCSGLEAPVHSCHALGIPIRHVFSSEKAPGPAAGT
jgi:hypothetical protein